MKINKALPILTALVFSTILISCGPSENDRQKNVNAAITLSNFGKNINDKGKIDPEAAVTLKDIAEIPTIIPKLFIENAILATGISYETNEPIVLSSITGDPVAPCSKKINDIYQSEKTKSSCKTKIIPSSKALETALSINQPIQGTIIKNGKEIPATHIVTVTTMYKGSHCTTKNIAGFQFEICLDIPHAQ